jgi:hypothetical protein
MQSNFYYHHGVTIFDLLFLVCVLTGIVTLIVAGVTRSLKTLQKLAVGIVVYIVMVYSATLFSEPSITRRGEPQCDDDWCLAVDRADRSATGLDIAMRILSRAKRVTQRELAATDVYLVDENWNRHDPAHRSTDTPLNTLLHPGESVPTSRHFDLPPSARIIGLRVGHKPTPGSLCLVIGECDAFHKGKMIALN